MSEQFSNSSKKNEFKRKLPKRVYYVYSPDDDTVLVAIDVVITGNLISWFDTVRERRMTIEKIYSDSPDEFIFKRSEKEGGQIYSLIPLTLDIYNKKVKNRLLSPKDFENEEDMLNAFEQTKENCW